MFHYITIVHLQIMRSRTILIQNYYYNYAKQSAVFS